MIRPDTEDYHRIFSENLPLLDVRAPVEFTRGSFPGAVNRPLLDDEQREAIGTKYKKEGPSHAIALGHALATSEVQARRVASWMTFVQCHDDGYLFCLRGGMRSQVTQEWLAKEGIEYPRVKGGYKAMRAYLLDSMRDSCEGLRIWVVSGRTGTGKTHLLPRLPRNLDLEGLAGHRGSSFGKRLVSQPTQADFEHRVAIELLRANSEGQVAIAVEDESKLIGRRAVPPDLFSHLKVAPLVVLEASHTQRVAQIVHDYVERASREYQAVFGDDLGWVAFGESLQDSLSNIQRRLGKQRYSDLNGRLGEALVLYRERGDLEGFSDVVGILLNVYYDPMYDYQLARKADRVRFRGNGDALVEWLSSNW